MKTNFNKLSEIFNMPETQEQDTVLNDENTVETPIVEKPIMQESGKFSIDRIFEQLADLVKEGKDVLEDAKYYLKNEPENVNIGEISQLFNSISDILKEFNKIYLMKLKHEHVKEIEQLKINGKMQLMQQMQKEKRNEGSIITKPKEAELVPYCQETIVQDINSKQ